MAAIVKRMTKFVQSRPALNNMVKPIADKYIDLAGYRKLGLLYGLLSLSHQSFSVLSLSTCGPFGYSRHAARPSIG